MGLDDLPLTTGIPWAPVPPITRISFRCDDGMMVRLVFYFLAGKDEVLELRFEGG